MENLAEKGVLHSDPQSGKCPVNFVSQPFTSLQLQIANTLFAISSQLTEVPSKKKVDDKLHGITRNIHAAARKAATEFGDPDNYVHGANIDGFRKVADAMIDRG